MKLNDYSPLVIEPEQSGTNFTDFFFSSDNPGCVLALKFASEAVLIWFLNYITAQSTGLPPKRAKRKCIYMKIVLVLINVTYSQNIL